MPCLGKPVKRPVVKVPMSYKKKKKVVVRGTLPSLKRTSLPGKAP